MIAVATDDGSDVCEQCLGAIEYAATVDLTGGLPGVVAVNHGTGEDATEIVRVARNDS